MALLMDEEDIEEDLKAFAIKFEGWREATQKVGRWFQRVEEAVETFVRKWHEVARGGGNGRATEDDCNRDSSRWRQYKRAGGGEGGGGGGGVEGRL